MVTICVGAGFVVVEVGPWRGDLAKRRTAPFGCEAVVKPLHTVYLIHRVLWFWGGFAAERGGATLR